MGQSLTRLRPLVMLRHVRNKDLIMSNIVETFRKDLAEVSWRDLRIHLQREAIICVDATLDLITVAVAVAEDDKKKVEQWLQQCKVGKPSAEQLRLWEGEQEKRFQMLIVQPFILVQDVLHG
jgi:hypothetical protein